MNIIEAIKSGKSFKRTGEDEYIHVGFFKRQGSGDIIEIQEEDLFADDWEIEEEKIELTKSQFIQAWVESAKEAGIESRCIGVSINEIISRADVCGKMCKKLGFKE